MDIIQSQTNQKNAYSQFAKIYDLILSSPEMSFAKIKALGEDGLPMKNVFILESAQREGFLIVVNCDDLG